MNAVALVAALIDAFWQSALLVVTAAVVLRCMRRAGAAVHATVWFAVIIVGTLLPVIDALRPAPAPRAVVQTSPELHVRLVADAPASSLPATALPRVVGPLPRVNIAIPAARPSFIENALTIRDGVAMSATAWLQRYAVTLLAAWGAVSAFMLTRIVVSIITIARMKRRARPNASAAAVARGMGVRRSAQMLVSDDVQTPCVFGYRHPAVVFPAALINELTADGLDAVARHELAHVARFDDWTQLAERIAIALVPMLLPLQYASRRLALQREIACDDAVVQSHDDALRYAQTLAAIAKRSVAQRRLFATPGLVQRSLMLARIQRIVSRRAAGDRRTTTVAVTTALACVAVVSAAALCMRPVSAALITAPVACTAPAKVVPLHLSVRPTPPLKSAVRVRPLRIIGTVQAIAARRTVISIEPNRASTPVHLPPTMRTIDVRQRFVSTSIGNAPPLPRVQMAEAPPVPPIPSTPSIPDSMRAQAQTARDEAQAARDAEREARQAAQLARADAARAEADARESTADADTLREMHEQFGDLSAGQLAAMEVQGIDGDYLRDLSRSGFGKLSTHDVIALKIQGIDGQYLRDLMRAGIGKVPVHDLIGMKIQGIDGAYLRSLRDAGLTAIPIHELIGMRIQGIDGTYVRSLRDAGLTTISVHDLVALKIAGVDAAWLHTLRDAGITNLNAYDVVRLRYTSTR